MIRPTLLLSALLVMTLASTAQVRSDGRVVLTGDSAADRRVMQLADPDSPEDALNARSLLYSGYAFASVPGGNVWNVSLVPASDTVMAGMKLRVLCATANTGPVTITVDGQGPYAVQRAGGLPLLANTIQAGEIAVLLFNGSVFQLVRAERRARSACPAGQVMVNEQYCIEIQERDTLDFYQASAVCGALNARLCTWMEWYYACNNATTIGVTGMVGNWEWTNNTANGDQLARVVGQSTCTQAATSPTTAGPKRNFRCCYRR